MPRQQQALTMKPFGHALMDGLRGIIRKSAFCRRENPEESDSEPEEQLLL